MVWRLSEVRRLAGRRVWAYVREVVVVEEETVFEVCNRRSGIRYHPLAELVAIAEEVVV